MDEIEKMESHLSSAAAFVEGGIQDSCDDACSICLEGFCASDPSAVTTCKHEFHLQCILEWCQRSRQCPMCWQPISLKDPTSQELLEVVELERSIRSNQTRNTTIFHHPTLGDIELQHLPVDANDVELEERIIQHLAAAAAMGRAPHTARREGHRIRTGVRGRPQFLVFSGSTDGAAATNSAQRGANEPVPSILAASPSSLLAAIVDEPSHEFSDISPFQADGPVLPSGSSVPNAISPGLLSNRNPTSPSSPLSRDRAGTSIPSSQDRAGPSDLQSLSESLKSRLNSVSIKYKESITKSTRGWKERLLSRNTSLADLGSEVRREVNAGIASVSRMMERLDTRESRSSSGASSPRTPRNAEGPN